MSRDERWRRVGRRSAAVACAVGVGGAWLLLTQPLEPPTARRLAEPGANTERTATRETASDGQQDSRASDIGTAPALRGGASDVSTAPALRGGASDVGTAPALRGGASDLQHPITDEHRALYRDSDLLDAGWRALQAHDFTRARAVLAQHRAESARSYDDLNDGLTILADCMQYPSAQARDRAQRFYDDQTYSMARRRIRRYCLEPSP